ncbi:hypothetical protein JTB14_031850 [Gonioctena quinquepunctata]|nr:hypothetical protein JTB14_031850 [Gonioctena quinquepunctata]
MLGISMDHEIDILRILSYPITPIPLALCHSDGTIYKTDKSALAKAEIDHNPPGYSDIHLIDGFFILHAMEEIPKTFGSISKRFLQMITKYPANRIDVIFDQYWHPLIKDHERQLRKEAPIINYSITGPDQITVDHKPQAQGTKTTKRETENIQFSIIQWISGFFKKGTSATPSTTYLTAPSCSSTELCEKRLSDYSINKKDPLSESAEISNDSSESETEHQPKKQKRSCRTDYKRIYRFNRMWLNNPDLKGWLSEGPSNSSNKNNHAYCKVCQASILAHKSVIKSHAKSVKHKQM